MILGRPINLWLGLVTAVLSAVQVIGVVVFLVDPTAMATISGSIGGVLGAVIALVAVQTPTVLEGGQVQVQTPAGQPNATGTLGVSDGEVTVTQ
jgi:hypothetical protein